MNGHNGEEKGTHECPHGGASTVALTHSLERGALGALVTWVGNLKGCACPVDGLCDNSIISMVGAVAMPTLHRAKVATQSTIWSQHDLASQLTADPGSYPNRNESMLRTLSTAK